MSTKKHGSPKKHPTEAIVAASGTVAGAVVGSIAGATAGAVLEDESERAHQHDEELDQAIGVYDGELGAAPPNAPPARIGAFSAGASGAGRTSTPPASGPIQDVDEG